MRDLIAGDLAQLWLVREIEHQTLYSGTGPDRPYLVTAAAVHRVLSAYRADPHHMQRDAQLWAQFIRVGMGPGPGGSEEYEIYSIETDYQPDAESLIVDAIYRLDNLGDEIDGVITMDQADELLAKLEEHMP